MSHPGLVIDSVRFAYLGGSIAGSIPCSALTRLAEQLDRIEGAIEFAVRGSVEDGKPFLTLDVRGELVLRCQRCLSEASHSVALRSRLLLIQPGVPWPEDEMLEDSFDAIPADPALDLASLVEDEVMLALPISPRHEACAAPDRGDNGGEASPFAGLERLLRH
jgi:uncharacterized protein